MQWRGDGRQTVAEIMYRFRIAIDGDLRATVREDCPEEVKEEIEMSEQTEVTLRISIYSLPRLVFAYRR